MADVDASKKNHDDDDGSDSDDSDYVPGADAASDGEEEVDVEQRKRQQIGHGIKASKRTKIDALWQEMNDECDAAETRGIKELLTENRVSSSSATARRAAEGATLSNGDGGDDERKGGDEESGSDGGNGAGKKRKRDGDAADVASNRPIKVRRTETERQQKKILAGIFGPAVAETIIQRIVRKKARTAMATITGDEDKDSVVDAYGTTTSCSSSRSSKKRKAPAVYRVGSGSAVDRETALKAVANAKAKLGTVQFEEVRKFAGRDIKVTHNVQKGSEEEKRLKEQAKARAEAKTGLDSVLSTLNGPEKVSTVSKSSMDWKDYKEKEGLEDELSKVTKDGAGYLNRQDFLERVDVRQFELEKEARIAASSRKS